MGGGEDNIVGNILNNFKFYSNWFKKSILSYLYAHTNSFEYSTHTKKNKVIVFWLYYRLEPLLCLVRTKSDSKQIIPITFFWMFILKCKKKAYIYFTLFHNSFYNLFYLILGCNFFHYTFFYVYCIILALKVSFLNFIFCTHFFFFSLYIFS